MTLNEYQLETLKRLIEVHTTRYERKDLLISAKALMCYAADCKFPYQVREIKQLINKLENY